MANVTWRRGLVCAIVVLAAAANAGVGLGQSFLEKLESVVREKLNTPDSDAKATAAPKTGAELPSPNRANPNNNLGSGSIGNPFDTVNGAPTKNAIDKSILENRPRLPTPPRPEGLQLAPSTEGVPNSIETAESTEPAGPTEPAGVYLGLEVEELVGGGIGVRVSSLSDRSPAWKAGFKVGDLLQAIDGHAVSDIDGMAERLRRLTPGKPAKFLVKRSGRNLELVAVLQNAALAKRLGSATELADGLVSGPAFLGVLASDLSPAFRTQFGLAVYSGAAVTNVATGSPAHTAGIQPGDAIVEINGTPINRGDDLVLWMAGAQIGQAAELLVYRGTQPSTISVVLSGEQAVTAPNDRMRASSRSSQSGTGGRPNTALQVEIEQLRAELEQTQQQLLQSQKRLEEVLLQLDQNR